MLGANIALPAAFLCVSRQLELLSSTRTIPFHPTVVRNWLIFDIFMCYLLPIIYILLRTFNFFHSSKAVCSFFLIFFHLLDLVVQNHRFDLVENLGCSASVDPSAVGILLVWIPPVLICSISIVFLGLLFFFPYKGFKSLTLNFSIAVLSIRNSLRHGSGRLLIHLESRSTLDSSCFYRCLVISMTTTITAGLVSLLGSFSGPSLHPWSWDAVHASMSEIHIVSSQDRLGSIQLAWWGGFVVTVLYLLLSYCLGEETRDIFKWIRQKTTTKERFVLPMQCVFFL
jgi:pheromone a factor receptor